jgi:non-heme chloroperoxidase
MVCIDLRGHGLSDKPMDPGAYWDVKLWAEDVRAVITELGLDRPILNAVGYGGIVLCDYLRCYGDADLAGVHFAGGTVTKIGTAEAFWVLNDEFLALTPGLVSNEVSESVRSLLECASTRAGGG